MPTDNHDLGANQQADATEAAAVVKTAATDAAVDRAVRNADKQTDQ